MARGRIGAERTTFTTARRRAASVPVDLSGPAPSLSTFTRARDISSAVYDNSDAVRVSSKRQDQKLLDNITNTLYDLEMSTVKPRMEVALKTGFRRLIYDKKRPPLEPQTKARSLSRHLRRPYVYTQDSLFSVPRTRRTRWESCKASAETTYKPFEKPEVSYKPYNPTLKMAANFNTRSSAAILDHIHQLARQDYIGETPARATDELGVYVSDILNRSKTRHLNNGPKNYYVATEVSGALEDDEEEGGYGNSNSYDGYDVYLPVKVPSNNVYADDDNDYYFVPESISSRSFRGASTAPLPWRDVAKRELGKGSSGGYDVYSDPYYGAIEAPMASPVYVPTRVTRAGSSRSMSVPPPIRRYSVSGTPSSSYISPSSPYASPSSYSQASRIAGIEVDKPKKKYNKSFSSCDVSTKSGNKPSYLPDLGPYGNKAGMRGSMSSLLTIA